VNVPAIRITAAGGLGEFLRLADLLHDNLHNLVKDELHAMGLEMLPGQALLLVRIGDQAYSPSEFREKGIYLRSNACYALNRLCAEGYLEKRRRTASHKIVEYFLTPKGQDLRARVEAVFERVERELLGPLGLCSEDLRAASEVMARAGDEIGRRIRHIW
jgi:DNA-binding MarR family transcriptional regulator